MKRQRDGQNASATVEMAILLPVYMLMTVAVLSVGHLVLIRQKVVEAVRFQAWLPGDPLASDQKMNSNLFQNFTASANGSYSGSRTRAGVDFSDSFYQGCYQNIPGASARATQLAIAVLNDNPAVRVQGRRHLFESRATGSFTYKPVWLPSFLGVGQVSPNTQCIVYLRSSDPQAERKVLDYDSNSNAPYIIRDRNPIEDYVANNSYPGFQISIEGNGANEQNRFFTSGAKDARQDEQAIRYLDPQGGINPDFGSPEEAGLWNRQYRLGGSLQAEHDIFYRMLY
jgi:hypothetical protein